MSPEHLSGESRSDERTDVYGFGLLLYESLTGQTPFPGEPSTELFKRVLTELPPPVTKFRPDLPPGLVRIIDVAIAKDPDHRYSDLNLMVTALEEEVLPATPLAHLVTPITGVPTQPFRDAGQSVVQAILRKESSAQYQETRILYGFPREKQNGDSQGGEAGAANGAGAKGGTSARRQSGETVLVRFKAGQEFLRIRSLSALRVWSDFALRPWLRSALHRRRELVGAGIAVALALTVWVVLRGPGRGQAAMPNPGPKIIQPALESAKLSPRPSIVPTVTLAPATFGASGEMAAPGQLEATSEERAVPVQTPPSRLTAQELARDSPQRRPGRSPGKAGVPARAPRDRAAAKLGRPRSGNLSEDDF